MRERFFTPRLRFKSYDELNAWLVDKCVDWAKAHAHPEQSGTDDLGGVRGGAAEARCLSAAASTASTRCRPRCRRPASCSFDNNRYSVNASAVGRPVEIHAYADRIVVRQDGRIVAEHRRFFGRGKTRSTIPGTMCRSWRASRARLRNGAPFQDWVLPAALERLRRKLGVGDDGDRQMVKILAAVLTDGLPAVEAACAASARRRRPSPTSSSTSWRGGASRAAGRRSSPRTRWHCGTRRSPTAPATTA